MTLSTILFHPNKKMDEGQKYNFEMNCEVKHDMKHGLKH